MRGDEEGAMEWGDTWIVGFWSLRPGEGLSMNKAWCDLGHWYVRRCERFLELACCCIEDAMFFPKGKNIRPGDSLIPPTALCLVPAHQRSVDLFSMCERTEVAVNEPM